jgi:anti-sigma B factor antagonist
VRVDVRQAGDVVIVDLEGKLVAGITGDALLADVLNQLLAEDWKKILLNLSQVSSIDSSGIGMLVASERKARERGASLRILRLEDRVASVLRMSQILPLFVIYDDEEQALGDFQG